MVISIEDFVSLPGRGQLTQLHPDRIDGATWFDRSGNGISKCIWKMMHELLKEPYLTYSSMPIYEQELWFKQFVQDFNWHQDLTPEVRKEFNMEAERQFSHTLDKWKQRWVKGKKPKWINNKVFEGLKVYWEKSETKSTSSINSNNQENDRGEKRIATYNADATSFHIREEHTQRDGLHTNNKNNLLQDPVAKKAVENSKKKKQEYIFSQGSMSSIEPVHMDIVNQIVYKESPKKKSRIFGLGNLSQARSCYCSSSCYARDAELVASLQEKDARIEALEKEMAEQKAENKRRADKMAKEIAENKRKIVEMTSFMEEMRKLFPDSYS